MVLFLHNRYRTAGGEERVVEDLLWLVRSHLGEPAELLARDSAQLGRLGAAAGLVRGGVTPGDVARAVRLSHARVVHAHNLQPSLGWRALAAAREAGARVVLHLHQYRLVCAVGVCFTEGAECTRCHGRNTLPGVIHNCRGSISEALAYGAALARWQRRLIAQADAFIAPSVFARERLQLLGLPLPPGRVHVLAPPVRARAPQGRQAASLALDRVMPERGGGAGARAGGGGLPDRYALIVSRLAPEKGIDVAIDACRMAAMPLLIAGEGPELDALTERVRGADARFLGRIEGEDLDALRANAAIVLVPSRSAESFGLAAAEAMSEGVPVAGSAVGALPELLAEDALVPPGNPRALAAAIERLAGDRAAGERGRERAHAACSPEVVAGQLAAIYEGLGGAPASP